MIDWHDIPETAFRAFEKRTGLFLGLHDRDWSLGRYLPIRYGGHYAPGCRQVKARAEAACTEFDGRRAHRLCLEHPDGFFKICHAGVLEWVAPALEGDRLLWVIFAGQRKACRDMRVHVSTPEDASLTGFHSPLAEIHAEEAYEILELMRQLVARLLQWRAAGERTGAGRENPDVDRRVTIRRFIAQHHRKAIRLADLAAHLHLSESRAAHVVRETCGMPFVRLLQEERLRSAAELLRHSDLTILEAALRSGFGDASHFHRLFRRTYGISPRQYRRQIEYPRDEP